ncbi:hypothetical protein F2Q69_00051919 [Brassica cretica]|uniref:Uncharacterized protein n=2 Tax=Brassica TaxID=3705 RepID=A0A8S9PXW3_BRACR|nr:hypothetical protein F2Q69_00051919 [Brassica cretica]CAF2065856.1 unnamed protein product [Brassica napus]
MIWHHRRYPRKAISLVRTKQVNCAIPGGGIGGRVKEGTETTLLQGLIVRRFRRSNLYVVKISVRGNRGVSSSSSEEKILRVRRFRRSKARESVT